MNAATKQILVETDICRLDAACRNDLWLHTRVNHLWLQLPSHIGALSYFFFLSPFASHLKFKATGYFFEFITLSFFHHFFPAQTWFQSQVVLQLCRLDEVILIYHPSIFICGKANKHPPAFHKLTLLSSPSSCLPLMKAVLDSLYWHFLSSFSFSSCPPVGKLNTAV